MPPDAPFNADDGTMPCQVTEFKKRQGPRWSRMLLYAFLKRSLPLPLVSDSISSVVANHRSLGLLPKKTPERLYTKKNPPMAAPITTSIIGFLKLCIPMEPVCNDPAASVDVAPVADAASTTAVEYRVVTAPFGRVDVKVEVLREAVVASAVVPADCDVARVV